MEAAPARSLRPAILAAAFNLVPIIGVIFWGWSAFALIFLYWLENLVIGVRTLASMFASAVQSGTLRGLGLITLAAFFSFHYGMFCFVHGVFVVTLFGSGMAGISPFELAQAAETLFRNQPGLSVGLLSIVLWQAVQLALFLIRGEAREANPVALMGAPYPRIIILHLTIIFG